MYSGWSDVLGVGLPVMIGSALGGVTPDEPGSVPGVLSDTAAVAERVVRIGQDDGDPDQIFARVVDIAAHPDGRFAVLDRMRSSVRVFSPEGELVVEYGRAGAGPGDFSDDVAGVAFGEEGAIFVLDPGLARITEFRPEDGRAVTSPIPGRTEQRILQWWQDRPGRVIERIRTFADDGDELRWRDLEDGGFAPIVAFDFEPAADGGGPDEPIELLGARPLWTALPDGTVAWAYAGPGLSPDVHVARTGGTHVFRVPRFPAQPITSSEAEWLLGAASRAWAHAMGRDPESIRFITDRFVLPDSLPSLTGLHAGPGETLLVQGAGGVQELDGLGLFSHFAIPLGGSRWQAVTADGETLGMVAGFAPGFRPFATVGDLMYGVEVDAFGVERVVVYRVRFRDASMAGRVYSSVRPPARGVPWGACGGTP